MSLARHWVFTVFSDEVSFFDHPSVQYCIFGNEKCPKTGRWHKQGYLCMVKKCRLSTLKKFDPTAHFEMKRGTVAEAIIYCKKDGDWYEHGVAPVEKGSNEEGFKFCLEKAKAGDFESIEASEHLGTYIRYKKTFDNYYNPDLPAMTEPRGVWMYGRPGCGKDTAVIEKYRPYVKPHNKWWDGYADQKVILFSDLDQNDAKWVGNHLKIWSDRYPFKGEIKGGVKVIHPDKFFVTSNYTIDMLFVDDLPLRDAVKRRFDQVDCDSKTVVKRPKMSPDASLVDLI